MGCAAPSTDATPVRSTTISDFSTSGDAHPASSAFGEPRGGGPLNIQDPPPGHGMPEGAMLGSRGGRFAARFVDGLVVIVPVAIASVVLHSVPLTLLLYVVGFVFYTPLMMAREGAGNGKTIGKQMVGVRVARLDGLPMTFGQGIMRDFVGTALISGVTLGIYGFIDSIWCLFDSRKQCIHDKIASTVVVRG